MDINDQYSRQNRQYLPPGISKASAPVRLAYIPHQGYRRPVPQSAVANTPTRDIECHCSSPPSPITSPG
ncbi:hypothetical protein PoB_000451000 [Plakobranchus ocellatus]|uniref:Uncharacterized protein n=1 Tax=Plakobranchus ocellatus TaxID=259542 RepID=A0AAV3Y4H1_9GAST|nr:hypothetical protein PoB_000451000 [Plakobranchus ocellatus]